MNSLFDPRRHDVQLIDRVDDLIELSVSLFLVLSHESFKLFCSSFKTCDPLSQSAIANASAEDHTKNAQPTLRVRNIHLLIHPLINVIMSFTCLTLRACRSR